MKSKMDERERAILLRKSGLSYSEIQAKIPVSQASLSLWLRRIELSQAQRTRLIQKGLIGQRAGAAARRNQRLEKRALLVKEVNKELPTLLQDPFFTLGLSLYWAEGTKEKPWRVKARTVFTNSDPLMLLIMRRWLIKYGKVSSEDFIYRLYIHATAPTEAAINIWAELLSISQEKLPVSLKKHIVLSRHKSDEYKGLIQMTTRNSTWLCRRIELWTQGAADHFLA